MITSWELQQLMKCMDDAKNRHERHHLPQCNPTEQELDHLIQCRIKFGFIVLNGWIVDEKACMLKQNGYSVFLGLYKAPDISLTLLDNKRHYEQIYHNVFENYIV